MVVIVPHVIKRNTLDPADALLIHHVGEVFDPTIMAYRPQRVSLVPSINSNMWNSVPEARPGSRRSTASSYASIGSNSSTYSAAPTTATSMGSRRSSFGTSTVQQRSRSTAPPPPLFKRMPPEVYTCILQQLRATHSWTYSQSCTTCYLRDLYNLALTSRAWDRAVRIPLYDRIHIVGHDSPAQLKKFKVRSGTRLKLLRRTLRERRILAQCVRELKVPNVQVDSEASVTEAINLVASIVMVCPNLEKLIGMYPTYSHNFDRLTHALSMRTKLKEHMWIIGENEAITERSLIQLPPGLMDREQARNFLSYHRNWKSLSTLVLHSQPNAVLEHDILISMFERLPCLQHVCLSSFDTDDFNDNSLQCLPPLKSLRLHNLAGITDRGLSHFVSGHAAQHIDSLSLIDIEISSLLVIAKLFAHLTQLTRFVFRQESSPSLPSDEVVFQPIMASPSLAFLHWDVLALHGTANADLASSIFAHGFPALRTLRAPSDHHGVLQALCRPRAQIILPSDKYHAADTHLRTTAIAPQAHVRTLHAARLAAQDRIDEARQTVRFQVVVTDGYDKEDDDTDEGGGGGGIISQIYDLNGFAGQIGSQIQYRLTPELAGSEDALVQIGDLRDEKRQEREMWDRDGCTGLWNASHPAGKKWWCHTERWRWKEVEMGSLF